MSYSALLTGHLAAVTLFLAGLFITGALLPGLTKDAPGGAIQRQEQRRMLGLAYFVTTPALLCVWGLGTAMAAEAGWFASGWLRVKLLGVLALSAWHGRQLATLRRLAAGRAVPQARTRTLALAVFVLAAIVVLVVEKPF